MKFTIKAKNIKLSEAQKLKITDKITKNIKQYIPNNESIWVDVTLIDIFGGPRKQGADQKCSLTIQVPGKTVIKIEETAENIETAVELAKDRMEKALSKYNDKKKSEKRRFSKEALRGMLSYGIDVSMWPARATKKAFNKFFKR